MGPFVRLLFWIRGVMLLGSIGSVLCALVMFGVGFVHLGDAVRALLSHPVEMSPDTAHSQVTVAILQAIDAFLFAIVFVIFAYGIAIGFVFNLPRHFVEGLPRWMRIEGVGELKHTLVEVVIVGLIVIFARVAVEQGRDLDWDDLVLPIAIVLLSASLKLMALSPGGDHPQAAPPSGSSSR